MHNFHTKNQEVSQQRLEVIGQKLSEVSFFGQKWPNFGHFRIFPDHTPTFSERVPQKQFLEQKSRKFIAAFGKYKPKRLKIVNFGPNWTILGHFGGQKNFLTKKIFRRFLSHMESQLHAKNQKKILNGQGCRSGTDARTHVRE